MWTLRQVLLGVAAPARRDDVRLRVRAPDVVWLLRYGVKPQRGSLHVVWRPVVAAGDAVNVSAAALEWLREEANVVEAIVKDMPAETRDEYLAASMPHQLLAAIDATDKLTRQLGSACDAIVGVLHLYDRGDLSYRGVIDQVRQTSDRLYEQCPEALHA